MEIHIIFGGMVYGAYSTFKKAKTRQEVLQREGIETFIITTTVNEDYDDEPQIPE